MFFDDKDLVKRRKVKLDTLPPIPDTGWKPPGYFPNLSGASLIAFDVETKETDWSHGPGWGRGPKGHICGFSVAAVDRSRTQRGKWYFPLRHEVEPEYNLDPKPCFAWLKHTLETTPHIPKVGAALIYDVGWLTEEGIYVQGELHDVQFAQSILDDQSKTALDYLGMYYLNEGKETSLLYDWIRKAYKPKETELRGDIYRSPARLVGPYGEQDADLPIRVLEHQWPLLIKDGLFDVYRMECDLIRLLVRMRLQGVRIDVPKAEQLYKYLKDRLDAKKAELHASTEMLVNCNSGNELALLFDKLQIKYPRTKPHDNPSIKKEWLTNLQHPIADIILEIRLLEKLMNTFVKGYLLEGHNNGVIHGNFNPLRDENRGAITGRFSSDSPNLQNIPVRTEEGKMIRRVFQAFQGHAGWLKRDYSQIEYRYLAHYAVGPGADELRADYNNNPDTDYHDRVYYAACPFMNWDAKDEELKKVKRRPIKNTNFGLVFGQGQGLLAYKLGLTRIEAARFFDGYHKAAPYVKPTMAAIAQEVQDFGYIQTILGRRVRFHLWEPIREHRGEDERPPALPFRAALHEYGSMIKRAYDYRGVNYKLQGSGTGDQIKMSMVLCDKAGIFDVTGVPLSQVHDELNFSVIDLSYQQYEAYREMQYLMENAIRIKVPVRIDSKFGDNWGEAD